MVSKLPPIFPGKRWSVCSVLVLCLSVLAFPDVRDRFHQPEKVMDVTGVKPGMIIGEVGAGQGYFTFKLAQRVGVAGRIFANDISRRALKTLAARAEKEGVTNIETIVGEVEDPLLPGDLDMVFIVNAFHDFAKPVELLNNLAGCLKPQATVVIMDRDPAKFSDRSGHFYSREEVASLIAESVFMLDRVEAFLPHHNLYIIRLQDLGN